jgi:hypothetical protein
MGRRGTLTLPFRRGARFLRLLIIPRAPIPTPRGGRCRIADGDEEPFDNTCPDITFPLDRVGDERISVTLEMESTSSPLGDPRELGLAIRGIQFLH